MHVVIGGAGEVGRSVAEILRRDGIDVVLVDKDPQACEAASHLDCMVLEGHAAASEDLEEAGISEADVFYAVTSHDEVNLAAAAIAKSHGAERVFARVNSMDLMTEAESRGFRPIGVDVAVSPDLVAAEKLVRLVEFPGILEMEAFEMGGLRVVETRVEPGSPAAGRPLNRLDLPEGANLVALFRGADVVIPRGDDVLHRGDHVVVVLVDEDLIEEATAPFGGRANVRAARGSPDHVVVAGATGVARHLARALKEQGCRVTMIAQADDRTEIEQLAADMEDVLVLEGSSRDVRVLREEGLDEADVVLAASPHDEFNMITCLLARSVGVPWAAALVDQPELEDIAERIGIDVAVSPRMTAVSAFTQYASTLDLEELALLHHGEAQVLVADVDPDSPIAGERLRDAGLPRGSVVAALLRGQAEIVPRGGERVEAGDKLVLFSTSNALPELTELL